MFKGKYIRYIKVPSKIKKEDIIMMILFDGWDGL